MSPLPLFTLHEATSVFRSVNGKVTFYVVILEVVTSNKIQVGLVELVLEGFFCFY